MTPKEKAQELYSRFFRVTPQPYKEENISFNGNQIKFQEWDKGWTHEMSKQCALIAVDEILKLHMWKFNSVEPYNYWQQVKIEIQKMQP